MPQSLSMCQATWCSTCGDVGMWGWAECLRVLNQLVVGGCSIIPATSEMIKVAWIQYLSILVVIWVIIRWARIFLFGQKLVASTAITDIAGKEHKY